LGSTVTLANMPTSAVSTFITVGITSMTVSWNANSNPADITEYTVVFSTGDTYNTYDGNIELSTKPIGTPIYASIATLSANTTYYLYVNAVSHNGVSTDYAALGSTVTHVIPPASAVSTFTAVMTNSLTAHWDANGNGDGTLYETAVSTSSDFPNTFPDTKFVDASLPAASPETEFSGLWANTTYYLFVRAVSHDGVPTAYIALGSTVTLANVPAFATPTFTAVNTNSMTTHWDANNNGAGTQYKVAITTDTDFPNSFPLHK